MNINDARLTEREVAQCSTVEWPHPPDLEAVLDAQLRKALWWVIKEVTLVDELEDVLETLGIEPWPQEPSEKEAPV